MYGMIVSLVLSWSWTQQNLGSFSSGVFGFNCVVILDKDYVRTLCLS